ncbi:GmrSD restriction endonuclease domain-containing protein [Pseudonocardia sichuanensis]
MASGGITGKAFSLEALFQGRVTYAIEYYQREYAWGADEVATLLADLVNEFERTNGTRRSRWAPPVEYFLGPFVYADEAGDRRFLVDGQQRFTTLHLIFLHLLRMAPDDTRPKTKHRLTNAVVAGYDGDQPRFRLDIDERERAMNALFSGKAFEPRPGDSLTVQNLWQRSEQVREDLAQRIQSDQHARFVDWLLDNVVMVGIEATDRDSGFRIFESMNDRGARLTSVDLMKSFLLSRANRDVERLNIMWRDMIREVTRQRGDADAPKEFLKAYLIGRHANLADDSDDAQRINDAPHIWARDHAADIDLAEEGESYHRFVSELIHLGNAYGNMVAATVQPFDVNEQAALYYNRVNGVTAQMALILAAVRRGDQDSVVKEKARIAANFVDLLLVLRAVNDESTRPDDLNREVLAVVPRVRDCTSTARLSIVLGEALPELSFDVMPTFGRRGDNHAQVRYVLSRLTAYVEKCMGNADAVEQYLGKDRTWHVEHLFPNHAEQHPHLTPRRFRALRERIGGLALLPGPDNSSVRDEPFPQKAKWYRQQNTLLAVLAPGYQHRNPRLDRFRTSHNLNGLLRNFGDTPALEDVVEVRGKLYTALARRIWDPAQLGLTVPYRPQEAAADAPPPPDTAPQPVPLPPLGRRTDLQRLLAAGRLKPGIHFYGTYRGTRHEVRLDDDGRLWLDDDSYRLPDDAGKTATGRKTCAGWKFWHVDLVDGTTVPLGVFRDNPSLVSR